MASHPTRNYVALAKRARVRRSELGLSIYAVAEKAGMSKDTYMRVENGLNVRDSTYSAVDTALGWSPGACISILEDANPAEIEEVQPTTRITEEDISQAVLAGIVANTDLAASTIRAIKDSVIGDLRRRGLL